MDLTVIAGVIVGVDVFVGVRLAVGVCVGVLPESDTVRRASSLYTTTT